MKKAQGTYKIAKVSSSHYRISKHVVWTYIILTVLIPLLTVFLIHQDQYENHMKYEGCTHVRTFETGSKVYSCPSGEVK